MKNILLLFIVTIPLCLLGREPDNKKFLIKFSPVEFFDYKANMEFSVSNIYVGSYISKNIVLGILTADCAPVLFYDPVKKVIGACHAGWKGALTGIIENTISKMQELGSKQDDCNDLGHSKTMIEKGE